MSTLTHFAINADDVEAARGFYVDVFGWDLQPWGPPGFYRVDGTDPSGPGVTVAVQQRRELVPGERTVGFECTMQVDDLAAAERRVIGAGGRIVAGRATIPTVGDLTWVADPSGNVFGLIQFESSADPEAAS